jgi:Protein of unknown function (DUF616)
MSDQKLEPAVPKVALYSAVYGDYDVPKPMPDFGVPAILYTDRRGLKVDGWRVRTTTKAMPDAIKERFPELSPNLQAKYWKLFPGVAVAQADVTVWLDGNVDAMNPGRFVDAMLRALGDDMLSLPKHPAHGRDCIYQEISVCKSLWPAQANAYQDQADFYRHIGHPEHWGLFATGIMVRRNVPQIAQLGTYWWDEVTNRTVRDQVSLPVLLRILRDERGPESTVTWNTNLPWGQDFHLRPHNVNNR